MTNEIDIYKDKKSNKIGNNDNKKGVIEPTKGIKEKKIINKTKKSQKMVLEPKDRNNWMAQKKDNFFNDL